ncbi:hypothetical protein [Paenibacillus polymyxa]|uniref:hypothetical protein n=1 Tax=Paenibacillus polymyxa TaxID=1406 RepID=UPI00287F953A|nr:hypothetical protein [Paenibacillus polymyxa]
MTQAIKARLIKNFMDKKAATQANTDAVKAFLQAGGSVVSPEFQELLQEREEAYFQWNNALQSLKVLPAEERMVFFGNM